MVECPPGCSEASSLPVFGTNGLYSDLSAICKAAVHAGVLKGSNGGLASVSLESSLPSYEGSTSNGVKSEALNTPNTIQLTNELKTDLQQQHQQQQQNGGGLPSKRRGRVTRSVRIVPVAKVKISPSPPCMQFEFEKIDMFRIYYMPNARQMPQLN